MVSKESGSKPTRKRKYDSPLRRRQLAETRERIIAAGAALVHELPTWDWRNLTARAVAPRAGVSVRTVHRHFPNERALRDAVLRRLVEESGIDPNHFELADFHRVTARAFAYLSSFAATTESPRDPSQEAFNAAKKSGVLAAVRRAAPDWPEEARRIAAAILDLAWDPHTHDHLRRHWELSREQSTRAVTWLVRLVQRAVASGELP